MKTRITALCLLAAALCLGSGCATATKKIGDLADTLQALDELGIKRAQIPGRATYTEYVREGNTSTLTHTNPGLAGPIVLVRERPASKAAAE